jgi:hypothetical protein
VIVRLGSENAEIMPTRRDYRLATAVASTLAHFVSEHAAAFDEMGPARIQESVVDASGLRLQLTYPAEALEDEWTEDAGGADTTPEVRLSAKVYEDVCELDAEAAAALRTAANARTRRKHGHSRSMYQLKVTLRDIRPPIWRRLEVRSDITLARLHDAIQDSMGWTDTHLHQFECDGELFGTPSADDWADIQSERRVRLDELLQHPKQQLEYVYDFGDSWRHRVVLEKVLPTPAGKKAPVPHCTGGRRACPPEDCGGVPGYRHLLHVLASPRDPEHSEMLEWVGGHFDPEAFEAPDA